MKDVELIWQGKEEMLSGLNDKTDKVLIEEKRKSVDWNNTKNVYIEGDNLEALKLLKKDYEGKIDVIYIDPPYNKNKKFIYNDKWGSHSNWLNMMYPRLKLARNLLSEKGIIAVSIDDHEQENMKKLLSEIFGESNKIAELIWHSSTAGGLRPKHFSISHQMIYVYAKNIEYIDKLFAPLSSEAKAKYTESNERGRYRNLHFAFKPTNGINKNQIYPIEAPDGSLILPKEGYILRKIESSYMKDLAEGNITFVKSNNTSFRNINGDDTEWNVLLKKYLENGMGAPTTVLPKEYVGMNHTGASEIKKIFSGKRFFDNPKSTKLLKYIFNILSQTDSIILDFFSGSGTTADAVMQLNAEDGGNRKFIMVQLPEEIDEKQEAYKEGYRYITEIGEERIRRAGAKVKEEHPEVDTGFRVYSIK